MSHDSAEVQRELARIRREGAGIWRFHYIVVGYDNEFVMRVPGWYTEQRAEQHARIALARKLKESARHIVLKSTTKEP